MTNQKKGLFNQLLENIRAVNQEYETLSDKLKKRLREKGFNRTTQKTLNRIADEILDPMLNGAEPKKQNKLKIKAIDPNQMTIDDFIQVNRSA